MNEEEKKAVQDSKNIINELNNHKDKDFIGRMYYKNKPIEEILEILLNLIEELQKENEELKKYKRYYDCTKLVVDNNYIHKQKIKDKIKELERFIYLGKNAPQDFLQYRVKAKIQGYKELLESEEK